jgi:hypothetical protein
LFYAWDTFLKKFHKLKTCKLKTKFPFKTVHFLGIRGLTTSSFTVYNYTTCRHTDMYSMYLLYVEYIYTTQYICFIYLF